MIFPHLSLQPGDHGSDVLHTSTRACFIAPYDRELYTEVTERCSAVLVSAWRVLSLNGWQGKHNSQKETEEALDTREISQMRLFFGRCQRQHQKAKSADTIGVAFNKNNSVSPHKDVADLRDGWAVMCCFDEFDDGAFCLATLAIRNGNLLATGVLCSRLVGCFE